ncbi:MAG: glycosyltransferase family 1 protein [Cyanobacteria bacterium P01_H01_bin.21]
MTSCLINLSALINKPTGISIYAQNLIPYLKDLEPVIFSAASIGHSHVQEIPQGLSPDFGIKGHIGRLWWLQRQLSHHYHQLGSSLIFSPLPEAPLYSNCRFVVTVHDVIPLRFPKQFSAHLVGYFRYYVRQVVLQADHIICDSAATARDVVNFYRVPAHKVTPILLAYDQAHFQPCQQEKGNYFLYLGRPDVHKNLSRVLTAFQACANNDVELWLVGPQDSRYIPELKAQAQHLGIDGRVRFLDYVSYEQLPRLLGGAIALVFPSLWEGFGLPPLEAMACGTPVITSNLASLPEVVGDAALLIDPYSVDELADAMSQVANSSQLRTQLSSAGLHRARQFSWEKTGQQTAEVLKRFL